MDNEWADTFVMLKVASSESWVCLCHRGKVHQEFLPSGSSAQKRELTFGATYTRRLEYWLYRKGARTPAKRSTIGVPTTNHWHHSHSHSHRSGKKILQHVNFDFEWHYELVTGVWVDGSASVLWCCITLWQCLCEYKLLHVTCWYQRVNGNKLFRGQQIHPVKTPNLMIVRQATVEIEQTKRIQNQNYTITIPQCSDSAYDESERVRARWRVEGGRHFWLSRQVQREQFRDTEALLHVSRYPIV